VRKGIKDGRTGEGERGITKGRGERYRKWRERGRVEGREGKGGKREWEWTRPSSGGNRRPCLHVSGQKFAQLWLAFVTLPSELSIPEMRLLLTE